MTSGFAVVDAWMRDLPHRHPVHPPCSGYLSGPTPTRVLAAEGGPAVLAVPAKSLRGLVGDRVGQRGGQHLGLAGLDHSQGLDVLVAEARLVHEVLVHAGLVAAVEQEPDVLQRLGQQSAHRRSRQTGRVECGGGLVPGVPGDAAGVVRLEAFGRVRIVYGVLHGLLLGEAGTGSCGARKYDLGGPAGS
jgi:hypothetical protein